MAERVLIITSRRGAGSRGEKHFRVWKSATFPRESSGSSSLSPRVEDGCHFPMGFVSEFASGSLFRPIWNPSG